MNKYFLKQIKDKMKNSVVIGDMKFQSINITFHKATKVSLLTSTLDHNNQYEHLFFKKDINEKRMRNSRRLSNFSRSLFLALKT